MKRQKLKATAEKMEEKIRPFGTMLGIVATFLVALATALASFASRILRNVDVTLVLFAVVVLLAILCFLLMRRCSILNRKVKASYETVVESNRKFVDDFVKAYHCIEKGHKQRDEGKPNPTFINFLNTETCGFLQKATDELRASLDVYLGDSVCVCVKFLEPKRQVNDALDPNDAKTSTFARSGNTDAERIHATSEEPAPLAKNGSSVVSVERIPEISQVKLDKVPF